MTKYEDNEAGKVYVILPDRWEEFKSECKAVGIPYTELPTPDDSGIHEVRMTDKAYSNIRGRIGEVVYKKTYLSTEAKPKPITLPKTNIASKERTLLKSVAEMLFDKLNCKQVTITKDGNNVKIKYE